jgi:hypothetical protein
MVYIAYEESMRRKVALKVLHENVAYGSSDRTRFEREAWIAGRLTHPNIVRVYGHGVAGTSRYIVMELVEGRSLASFVRKARSGGEQSRLSDSEWRREHVAGIVQLFVGIADALEYVHRMRIIHRDIKPQNLLLADPGGRLLLTDFGLAHDEEASRVTARGDFIGTLRYMSPEQLLAHRARIDHRTDLWSLGMSLYEAVTLGLPYEGGSEEAYISAVVTTSPVPARRRHPATPRDLETILMKCLERDPERRYASAAELRDDLQRYLRGEAVQARRAGPLLRSMRLARKHQGAIAASVIAAAVVATPFLVTALRDARQAYLLRSTLERIEAAGSAPERIYPDWPSLAISLREQTRRDPHGRIADLARAATTRVAVRLGRPPFRDGNYNDPRWEDPVYAPPSTSFARIVELPRVNLVVSQLFPIGVAFHALVTLDVELGQGRWRTLGWSEIVRTSGTDSGRSAVCSFPFPRELASPGARQLTFRANVAFRDPLESEDAFGLMNRCSAPNQPVRQELASRAVVNDLVRPLAPMIVTLHDSYPAEMPTAVDPAADATFDRSFKPDHLQLVQVRAPQPWTNAALIASEGQSGGAVCAPAGTSAGFVLGMDLSGTFTDSPTTPVAARVHWRPASLTQPLLAFPLVAGNGFFGFDGRDRLTVTADGILSPLAGMPGQQPQVTLSFTSRNDGPSALRLRFSNPIWLRELLPEGSIAGVLELTAARDLALANYFERYAASFSRAVPLEVRTVDGTWVSSPNCITTVQREASRPGQ